MKKNKQQTVLEVFMDQLNLKPYQKTLLKSLWSKPKGGYSMEKILYDDIKTALKQAVEHEQGGKTGVFPVVLKTTRTKRYCPRCDKKQHTSIRTIVCAEVFFGKIINYPYDNRECAICGRPLVDSRLQRKNDKALAKAFLKKYGAFPALSTHELKEIQDRLEASNDAFDKGLDWPKGTWQKYLDGEIPSKKHNKDLKALWEEYQGYKDQYGAFLHPKNAPKSFSVLTANMQSIFEKVLNEQREQDVIGAKEAFEEIQKPIREDLLEDTKVKLDKMRMNMPNEKESELFALCMQELEPWDVIVTNTKLGDWVEKVFNVYENEDIEYECWLRKPKMVVEKRGERLIVTTGIKEWVLHV